MIHTIRIIHLDSLRVGRQSAQSWVHLTLDRSRGTWVQSWVQQKGLFRPKMARKLHQINEPTNQKVGSSNLSGRTILCFLLSITSAQSACLFPELCNWS